MEEITLTLTVKDVENTLALFSLATIKASEASVVVELIKKYQAALPIEVKERK